MCECFSFLTLHLQTKKGFYMFNNFIHLLIQQIFIVLLLLWHSSWCDYMDITENLWRVTGNFLSKLCVKGHKSCVLLCKAGNASLTMEHALGNTCPVAGARLCSFLWSFAEEWLCIGKIIDWRCRCDMLC